MLTVLTFLLFGAAMTSSIASRLGVLRRSSILVALPTAILATVALFLAPQLGGWTWVLVGLAAAWAVVFIFRLSDTDDPQKFVSVGFRALLAALALVAAGVIRIGQDGVYDPQVIACAAWGLSGITAFIAGEDFKASPGLDHVEYEDSTSTQLLAARKVQRHIWWQIISAGVIVIAVLLMVVSPEAEATQLSYPIAMVLLAVAAVTAVSAGSVRLHVLARATSRSRVTFRDLALFVIAGAITVALASSAFWSPDPFSISATGLVVGLLFVVWFAGEVLGNASINDVKLSTGAFLGVTVFGIAPSSAFVAISTPASSATPLDTLLIGSVTAAVSVATLAGVGRLISQWPTRTLMPAYISLFVDSLMYWWLLVAVGLVVKFGDQASDTWIVLLTFYAGAGVLSAIIFGNDLQHYTDQAKRTKNPARWRFGEAAAKSFRRNLGVHLIVQWSVGSLLVVMSALGAFGPLGTIQIFTL